MPDDNSEAARLKAKALSRWEGEGGALGPPAVTLDEADMRILARLGAGLLLEWDAVPAAARETVFTRASTLHPRRDAERVKWEIARLLDSHQDR